MSKQKNLGDAEEKEKQFWQERAAKNAIEVANQLYNIIASFKDCCEAAAKIVFCMEVGSPPKISLITGFEILVIPDDRPHQDYAGLLIRGKSWYEARIIVPSAESIGRGRQRNFLKKIFFNYLPWREILDFPPKG